MSLIGCLCRGNIRVECSCYCYHIQYNSMNCIFFSKIGVCLSGIDINEQLSRMNYLSTTISYRSNYVNYVFFQNLRLYV